MTPADLLIVGAPVWTGDPARPWAEASSLNRSSIRSPRRNSSSDETTSCAR